MPSTWFILGGRILGILSTLDFTAPCKVHRWHVLFSIRFARAARWNSGDWNRSDRRSPGARIQVTGGFAINDFSFSISIGTIGECAGHTRRWNHDSQFNSWAERGVAARMECGESRDRGIGRASEVRMESSRETRWKNPTTGSVSKARWKPPTSHIDDRMLRD